MPADAQIIPDFELLRQIGRGSYGEVWLARSVTGIHRAIKIIHRERFTEERPFEREFAGLKRFEPISRSQENLVDILHVGRKDEQGLFYYVMELADSADGEAGMPGPGDEDWARNYRPATLREVLTVHKRLSIEECISIATGLTRAVKHLHEQGLIHRDIKPSNVIFVNGIPKLADIGLVSAVEESRSFVGTEGYVPPEGPGRTTADLFSLGKVLYEMSTGRDRLEFPKLPDDLEKMQGRERLLEFNEVFLKACHSAVKDRYASAEDLLGDLLLLQAGRSVKRLRIVEKRLARLVPLALSATGIFLAILLIQQLRTHQAEKLAGVESQYRRRAEAQESVTRQLLYAADMNLVNRAFAEGDLGRTKSVLAEHIPKTGEPDLRGFEWRYYWRLAQGEQAYSFPARSNAIASLAISPDGRLLASGGYDDRVELWDYQTRTLFKTFEAPGGVENVSFSPDGRLIMVSDDTGLVELKKIDTGQAVFQHTGRFSQVAISPTNPLFALGSGGKQASQDQGPGEVWDYRKNERLFSLPEAGTYVAFSPDGRRLATGSWNGEVKLWNVEDGKLLKRFGPVDSNFGMSFSPDGRRLAVGEESGMLQLWDLETGQPLASVQAHRGIIFKTAFSPDGRLIVTVGLDQTAHLWDGETLGEIGVLRGHASEVWCAEFTQDGRTVVTGAKDGTVCLWSVKPTAKNDAPTRSVNFWQWPVFSDDGRMLAVGELKNGVSLWRVSDGSPAGIIEPAQRPLAFGANAETLLTLGHEGELQEWKLSGTKALLLKQIKTGADDVMAHVFLLERGTLITGDRDGKVRVWDVNSGTELANWQAHENRVESMALSPDHTLLATASESDDVAKVWNLERRELKTTLSGHKMVLFSVAFAPDGQTVATASVDDTCRLWDPLTGKCLAVLGGHKGGTYSVAFAPDGRTLAVGSSEGELKLWNLATRRDMMTLVAKPGVIFSTGFSPDGKAMATVSFNTHNSECSLELWRAPEDADPR